MHREGLVFSEHVDHLMDDLVPKWSGPRTTVRVPLEVEDASGRSGWHTVSGRFLLSSETQTSGNWVHCTWPTSFLREQLGEYALLPDSALSSREVARSDVRRNKGQQWVKLPRFFTTIGRSWTTGNAMCSWDHDCCTPGATTDNVDLDGILAGHDIALVVGPEGPVFYAEEGGNEDLAQRCREACLSLMDLPEGTPVTLVSWHDEDPLSSSYSLWDTSMNGCSCFEPGPYRRARGWTSGYDY